jgi:type 1 glutamine amidotransferase
MTRRHFALLLAAGALLTAACTAQQRAGAADKKKVLVITHAAGFKHSSRPVAAQTVKTLGEKTGEWEVVAVADTAEDVNRHVNAEGLKNLHMVFFANTTGDLGLTPANRTAFYEWIRRGGAYAGVHSASDTYHGDADYLNLVRGEFLTHGPQVKVTVYNQDPTHPATKDLPSSFEIYDEIYLFKNWDRNRVHVLLSMHKHPNKDEAGDFPVAWTNRVGQGRMFYTSLGHREDVYENEIYLKHLTGGLRWALGLANGDDTPGNPIR